MMASSRLFHDGCGQAKVEARFNFSSCLNQLVLIDTAEPVPVNGMAFAKQKATHKY
jgi:hypothetical protein